MLFWYTVFHWEDIVEQKSSGLYIWKALEDVPGAPLPFHVSTWKV